MNAIQIHDRIKDLREQAAQAASEDRAEDAIRLGGMIDELNVQLENALKDEDAQRNAVRTVGEPEPVKWAPKNVAEAFLGPKDSFSGAKIVKDDELTNITNAVTGIPDPVRTERDIPGLQTLETAFLDTLAKGTTDGHINYLQAGEYTNAAARWVSGDKPESSYSWTDAVAHLEIIAHQTPVSVFALKHYGQLESIIRNELMIGLRNAEDAEALYANNTTNGIVGVTQTAETYTAVTGDNLYDTIVKMAAMSYQKSGIRPTHVAVSPAVATGLELLRADNGEYYRMVQGGRIAGLQLVVDANLAVTSGSEGSETTSDGIIVYNANAATWFTSEENEVLMGVIDKQFIQNTRTLLAEGEHALKVTYPKSFVYLASAL